MKEQIQKPDSSISLLDRFRNASKLSPIEQYKFFEAPVEYLQDIALRQIPGNPEATVEKANEVIRDAMLPPVFSNPNRKLLPKAMMLKRMLKSQLDIAA